LDIKDKVIIHSAALYIRTGIQGCILHAMVDLSTWVDVDLTAVMANVRATAEITDAPIMAVVKAGGYGHGAVEVAKAASEAGASWFAVARGAEAFELREAGIAEPVLVFGHVPHDQLARAVLERISMTVWDARQIEAAASAAKLAGEPAKIHLKVDTGMSRLGVQVSEAPTLAQQIVDRQGLELEGIFTHFARADEAESLPSEAQITLFEDVLQSLKSRPNFIHAANSAAGMRHARSRYDLVRLGIALYGLHPSSATQLDERFRPALVWKSRLLRVDELEAGRGVSYGHEYRTKRRERIGTVAVGYADGYRRITGNQMLVRGSIVPVVGRVCMDLCMVQLDNAPAAEPGDEVVLIGEQEDQRISAEQVADIWGTINYEVTCGISSRVPRIYRTTVRTEVTREWPG
jgi:alanine racemase